MGFWGEVNKNGQNHSHSDVVEVVQCLGQESVFDALWEVWAFVLGILGVDYHDEKEVSLGQNNPYKNQ